jgi:TonB family protein
MAMRYSPERLSLGLLPEPEGRTVSFITSTAANLTILIICVIVGMTARRVIQQHFELTNLVLPNNPPPRVKIKPQAPPPLPPPPKLPEVRLEAPKITLPKPVVKPAMKQIQMQAKLKMPVMKVHRAIVLAPQPKPALAAVTPMVRPRVQGRMEEVHLGDPFGVKPDPNATRPATVAALGSPYGGMEGPAVAPHGVVASAGIGNGMRRGSNTGVVGRVASAGIPGATGAGSAGSQNYGRVGSANMPGMTRGTATGAAAQVASTQLRVLFKPPVRYTVEARALHIQGNVVLRVTFLASGQVVVDSIIHGLGHGLDQEAWREAEKIRFRPATRNGRPVNLTTNIIITFQLA